MLKEYLTVYQRGEASFEEKKSRFISHVKPIDKEEEAIELIEQLKTRYWDASHHVYAYDVHQESVIQRFSDDGEPHGTAGLPIIELIKKMGLANLVVVVIRYFGGTMLGTAGLIKAYGKSATLGIEEAMLVKKILCSRVDVRVDYRMGGKIQNFALNKGHHISHTNYAEDVEFEFILPYSDAETFVQEIIEQSNDNALIEIRGKEFILFDLENKRLTAETK